MPDRRLTRGGWIGPPSRDILGLSSQVAGTIPKHHGCDISGRHPGDGRQSGRLMLRPPRGAALLRLATSRGRPLAQWRSAAISPSMSSEAARSGSWLPIPQGHFWPVPGQARRTAEPVETRWQEAKHPLHEDPAVQAACTVLSVTMYCSRSLPNRLEIPFRNLPDGIKPRDRAARAGYVLFHRDPVLQIRG